MLAGVLLLLVMSGPFDVAEAAPQVWLTHATDGTLIVVGDGWRAGQVLQVSLGRDHFPAYVDSAGGFEVPTGLAGSRGPLAVRAPRDFAFAELPTADAARTPNPLAIAFAQSLADGASLLFGVVALLSAALLVQRRATRRTG